MSVMISIVIPIYNRASIISRTLDSFISQTFQEWECIIVDDFSIDNTVDVVSKYVKRDERFKYAVNSHKKGAQGARNTGIEISKGEWVALFDSDDYAYPNYLEELIKYIKDDIDVVTSNARIIDVEKHECVDIANWCAKGLILKKLLKGEIYVGYNCCIIRKRCFKLLGNLDEQCPSMQEYDTHIRLSKLNCTYAATNMILSDYYVGGKDTISIDNEKYINGLLYVLKKHQFVWRIYAYREFLLKIEEVWNKVKFIHVNSTKCRLRVLLIAPELPTYMLLKRIIKRIKWI